MRVVHDRVAAIDVHKDMVKVAVRVPGEKRGKRKTDVLEFRAFYGVLQEMGRELRRRGVTHVVTEASGVYTDPVYYALAELDFEEVMVISPSHAKALKGRKTDARDAIRLLDDLGAGYYDSRESAQARHDYLVRQLQKLNPGCVITIAPPEAA